MKRGKEKKGSRAPKVAEGSQGVSDEKSEQPPRVLNGLIEAFDSAFIGDTNAAHKVAEKADVRTRSCSSSSDSVGMSSSSGSSTSDVFIEASTCQKAVYGNGFKRNKPKVVAATGTVSTVLGKNYVMSSPRKDLVKRKGYANKPVSKEGAEQFLCSMLGEQCELSMAVVSDVLGQCGYDVEKALDVLLELSASSYEQSKNDQSCDSSAANVEDGLFFQDYSDNNLTDRASDSTSLSSENEHQDYFWSNGPTGRNYTEVLASSHVHSPNRFRGSKTEIPHMVLESLFNLPKSSEHEQSTMNWKNVVKKMESLGQRLEFCPSGTAEAHENLGKGDEYQLFRQDAKQQWDSMKSYYQKAATAYSNGNREHAAYLSEQGKMCNKMAREADEKASQEIFQARNKCFENVITIDLHGQHVKQGIRLLKLHLLFGAYVRSVQTFRVITGCGSRGLGKSKLKQSVINLIGGEGIEWKEENQGTLLIRLHGHRDFNFLESESDND